MYNILQNEIGLILPTFGNRKKRFIATILGSVASKIIGLAFEGISSFLYHKRQKDLHKAVRVINRRTDMEHNRVYHLEDSMIMYGKYNSDNLMSLIDMVHRMHTITTWKERIFVGKMNEWLKQEPYSKAIRILSKGYLAISLIPPSKLEAILQGKISLSKEK